MNLPSREKDHEYIQFTYYLSRLLYLINFLLIFYFVKKIFDTHSIEIAVAEYAKIGDLSYKVYIGIPVIIGIMTLFKKPAPIYIKRIINHVIINILITAFSYPISTWIVVLINSFIR